MGEHVGPVLRTGPPIDSAAEQMHWDDSMEELAERRRTGRFKRSTRDVVKH